MFHKSEDIQLKKTLFLNQSSPFDIDKLTTIKVFPL